jgi:hypothetical protein
VEATLVEATLVEATLKDAPLDAPCAPPCTPPCTPRGGGCGSAEGTRGGVSVVLQVLQVGREEVVRGGQGVLQVLQVRGEGLRGVVVVVVGRRTHGCQRRDSGRGRGGHGPCPNPSSAHAPCSS